MSHQSLYRLYRPTTFEAVVGQNHIERTLRNAVATDSVAHAYLFSGPRGTGKTTTARILAAALVCGHTKEGEPDGDCEQCQQISEGRHPDIIELDAASQTGVDNVREEIISKMHLATVHGKSKVYIIDEVHMLSKGAFNALLKTLEEPPQQVVFILCTTDPQKVLGTVRSRCQEFDFHPISVSDIAGRLGYIADKEGIKAEPAALELIARHAAGGMRDAITLLEQMSAYSGGDIKASDVEDSMGGVSGDSLADIMRIIARRDTPACFTWVAKQVGAGADLVEVTRALLDYARDTYVISALNLKSADAGGVNRSGDDLKTLEEIAKTFSGSGQLERLLDLLFELSDKLRWSTEPRILIELTLARATNVQGEVSFEALVERIERLEQEGVAPAAPQTPTSQTVPQSQASASAPVNQAQTPAPASEPATVITSVDSAPVSGSDSTSKKPALSTDEASLNRNWAEILEHIRQVGPSRYPLFADARLSVRPDDQALIIEFAQADSFKYKQAKRADNQEILAKAIHAIYGQEISFSCREGSFEATPSAPASSAPSATLGVPAPAPTLAPAQTNSYEQQAPAYEPVPDSAYEDGGVPPTVTELIPPASILEPTPLPDSPRSSGALEVSTLLEELGATKIKETNE
ncbi:MAG: DNA polymerase III subunit gamma/tau [Coriobacteriia bacterium]|nr:DNA polymerase III subunit gamma/tau [Coriobacteriia bacterium]